VKRVLLAVVLGVLLSGAVACGSSKPKVVTPIPPTDLRGKPAVEIEATGFQFTPASIIVTVGTKVTWRNTDSIVHNVKKSADILDFGAPFGTDTLNPGGTYVFTFAKVGSFPYACTIHAGMVGRVQVVAKA
jgi:plastocyanin